MHRLKWLLAAGLLLSPQAALAQAETACVGQLVMACTIGKKQLSLCLSKAALTYQFGPAGHPEMSLTRPFSQLDYQPWPGVGMEIWEQVSVSNGAVRYEVWSAAPREGAGRVRGGVNVVEGARVLAKLNCKDEPRGLGLPAIADALAAGG